MYLVDIHCHLVQALHTQCPYSLVRHLTLLVYYYFLVKRRVDEIWDDLQICDRGQIKP
jgi:hypothetical protein